MTIVYQSARNEFEVLFGAKWQWESRQIFRAMIRVGIVCFIHEMVNYIRGDCKEATRKSYARRVLYYVYNFNGVIYRAR